MFFINYSNKSQFLTLRTKNEVENKNENEIAFMSKENGIIPKKKRGIKRPLESEIDNINVTPKKSACKELLTEFKKVLQVYTLQLLIQQYLN